MKDKKTGCGVETTAYAQKRAKRRGSLSYRVNRRALEVLGAVERFGETENCKVLDIGTAEGLMLRKLRQRLPGAEFVGLEYSLDLLSLNSSPGIYRVCGDAQRLPIGDSSMDVVICTALIEHLTEPRAMVAEAFRVLKREGVMAVTTPDPFWDKIAGMLHGGGGDTHVMTFDIKNVSRLLKKCGFSILEGRKFMLSPCGMPAELVVERVLEKLGLDFLFLNQLIVGRKGG